MAKTVKWTEAAWSDLDGVADYIAADSPFYAAAFVREVREAARSLNVMPERGSIVPELENSKIREIFVRKYRLIFQIQRKQVLILGFIHGARDLTSLLERERRRGSKGIEP